MAYHSNNNDGDGAMAMTNLSGQFSGGLFSRVDCLAASGGVAVYSCTLSTALKDASNSVAIRTNMFMVLVI